MVRAIFGALLGSVLGSAGLALFVFGILAAVGSMADEEHVIFAAAFGWCAGLVAGTVAGVGSAVIAEIRALSAVPGERPAAFR